MTRQKQRVWGLVEGFRDKAGGVLITRIASHSSLRRQPIQVLVLVFSFFPLSPDSCFTSIFLKESLKRDVFYAAERKALPEAFMGSAEWTSMV